MKFKNKYPFENRNRIPHSDWWDLNFFGGFLNSKSKLKEQLNEKRIRFSNENISSRVINHWQERGLISDDRPNGKGWRKFSISEIIWLEIIVKLRKFGMDFEKIKKVKGYLETFYRKESPSKFPELDFYILIAINSKKPVKLIVFDNGEALLANQSEIDMAKQMDTIIDDYITIDLNKIVMKGLKKEKNETDYLNYSLSNIEREVQDAILIDEVISIKLKKKNGNEYIMDKEFIIGSAKEMNILLNRLNNAKSEISKNRGKLVYKFIEKKIVKKY